MSIEARFNHQWLPVFNRMVSAMGYLALAALALLEVIFRFDSFNSFDSVIGLVNIVFSALPLIVVGVVFWRVDSRPSCGLPRFSLFDTVWSLLMLCIVFYFYGKALNYANEGLWPGAAFYSLLGIPLLFYTFRDANSGDGRAPEPAPECQQPGLRDALVSSDGGRGLGDTDAFRARERSIESGGEMLSAGK